MLFHHSTSSHHRLQVRGLRHSDMHRAFSHEAALLASSTGNLAVSFLSSPDGAPLFSVLNGQLLHYANESHILYANDLDRHARYARVPL